MPDPTRPMNAEPPDPLASALRALQPVPPDVSRDRLLFDAGRAAALGEARPWRNAAVGLGALSAALFVVVAFQLSSPRVVQQQFVTRPAEPAPQPAPPDAKQDEAPPGIPGHPSPPAPAPTEMVQHDDGPPVTDESARMWRNRQEALRWGVEMLPQPPPVRSVQTPPDLDRWLGVPPGTFASPYRLPRSPLKPVSPPAEDEMGEEP